MKDRLSDELINIELGINYIVRHRANENFEVKHKVMYLIDRNNEIGPKELMEMLGLKKSNLAIICNALVKQGFVNKRKIEGRNKGIVYTLTAKGTKLINDKLEKIDKVIGDNKLTDSVQAGIDTIIKLVNTVLD